MLFTKMAAFIENGHKHIRTEAPNRNPPQEAVVTGLTLALLSGGFIRTTTVNTHIGTESYGCDDNQKAS